MERLRLSKEIAGESPDKVHIKIEWFDTSPVRREKVLCEQSTSRQLSSDIGGSLCGWVGLSRSVVFFSPASRQ